MSMREGSGWRIARNTLVLGIGRVLALPLALLLLFILTRYLDPAGFGDLKTALAHVFLFGILTDLGLSGVAVREMARRRDEEAQLFGLLLSLRLILSLVAVTLAVGTAWLVPYPARVRMAILLASLSIPVHALIGSHSALLQSRIAMGATVVADLLGRFVGVGAALAVLIWGGGVLACIAAGLGAAGLQFLALRHAMERPAPLRWRWDGSRIRSLIRDALPLGMAALAATFLLKLDLVMIGALRTSAEAGGYGVHQSIMEGVAAFPGFLILSVYPLLSEYHERQDGRLFRTVRRTSWILILGAIPIGGALAWGAPLWTRLVAGPDYAPEPLVWLALALPCTCLATFWGYALVAAGRQMALAWITGGAILLNAGINLAVIPEHGAVGAAWVTGGTELFSACLAGWFLKRTYGRLPPFSLPEAPAEDRRPEPVS